MVVQLYWCAPLLGTQMMTGRGSMDAKAAAQITIPIHRGAKLLQRSTDTTLDRLIVPTCALFCRVFLNECLMISDFTDQCDNSKMECLSD